MIHASEKTAFDLVGLQNLEKVDLFWIIQMVSSCWKSKLMVMFERGLYSKDRKV